MKDGFLKAAAFSPALRVADCTYNAQQILADVQAAAARGVKLAVFPEFCLTGYTCGDLFLQHTLQTTASVFPLIPGPNLYYVMYGCVSQDPQMVFDETIILLATCLAIAFGFIIVDVASRSIMHAMKREYHIGKSALNLPLIGGKK